MERCIYIKFITTTVAFETDKNLIIMNLDNSIRTLAKNSDKAKKNKRREGEEKAGKPTTPAVPRRSPIQVLGRPYAA